MSDSDYVRTWDLADKYTLRAFSGPGVRESVVLALYETRPNFNYSVAQPLWKETVWAPNWLEKLVGESMIKRIRDAVRRGLKQVREPQSAPLDVVDEALHMGGPTEYRDGLSLDEPPILARNIDKPPSEVSRGR